MEGHANGIKNAIDELDNRRRLISKQFGRPKSPLPGNTKTERGRLTNGAPLYGGDQTKSRIPLYLFGNTKDEDDCASDRKPEDDRSKGEPSVAAETDKYGFYNDGENSMLYQ